MEKPELGERFELRLTTEHMERLKRLRKLTDFSSHAEVVRAALKAYESLLNKRKV